VLSSSVLGMRSTPANECLTLSRELRVQQDVFAADALPVSGDSYLVGAHDSH
jgi:hypothetical protein